MMKFVNRVQSEGQEIVAIKFDDSNNLEFIVGKKKVEQGNWCNPNPDGEGLAGNEKIDVWNIWSKLGNSPGNNFLCVG